MGEGRLEGRYVVLQVDPAKQADVELLDGCYVVESDVPSEAASTEMLWERYGDLQDVRAGAEYVWGYEEQILEDKWM